MRISDWSSDVCSSDLLLDLVAAEHRLFQLLRGIEYQRAAGMRAAAATENHGFGQFLCARQFLRHVAESLVETGDVLIRGLGVVELELAQIGRASCREIGWWYVWNSVVTELSKNKTVITKRINT